MDTKPAHTGVTGHIKGYFLTGVLATAPIGVAVMTVWWFLEIVENAVRQVIPFERLVPPEYLPYAMPAISLAVGLGFFVAVGWMAHNVLGRLFLQASEFIVARVPVIRTIYSATKQFLESVMTPSSSAFKEVVLMEFPSPGLWSIGFVTGPTKGEVARKIGADELVNIYLPTTPIPTTGYLLFVPKSKLIYLDMTAEEAIKMIFSSGLITPPEDKKSPDPEQRRTAES